MPSRYLKMTLIEVRRRLIAKRKILVPTQSNDTITPHAESWQSILWHFIGTDPRLLPYSNKRESLKNR